MCYYDNVEHLLTGTFDDPLSHAKAIREMCHSIEHCLAEGALEPERDQRNLSLLQDRLSQIEA